MKIKNKIIRKIIYYVLLPIVYGWIGFCWCIMKLGRGIYWLGNKLSGDRLDPYNWTQEI